MRNRTRGTGGRLPTIIVLAFCLMLFTVFTARADTPDGAMAGTGGVTEADIALANGGLGSLSFEIRLLAPAGSGAPNYSPDADFALKVDCPEGFSFYHVAPAFEVVTYLEGIAPGTFAVSPFYTPAGYEFEGFSLDDGATVSGLPSLSVEAASDQAVKVVLIYRQLPSSFSFAFSLFGRIGSEAFAGLLAGLDVSAGDVQEPPAGDGDSLDSASAPPPSVPETPFESIAPETADPPVSTESADSTAAPESTPSPDPSPSSDPTVSPEAESNPGHLPGEEEGGGAPLENGDG